jgi:hypothetical protein
VTEEDLVVAPSEYWEETLKAAVEDMLQMKRNVTREFDLRARPLI